MLAGGPKLKEARARDSLSERRHVPSGGRHDEKERHVAVAEGHAGQIHEGFQLLTILA